MKQEAKGGKRQMLVILDTHAILHRAYHAMPGFTSSKGEPTGALYGLSSMLLAIIKEFKPDYLLAAFDLPEPTFRDEMYKDYKAGRAKIEDDLIYQLNRAKDLLRAFGVPVLESPGFEADDILATVVEMTRKDNDSSLTGGLDIIIASGDMDTLQLLDDKRVKVYTLKTGIKDTVLYDAKKVVERYGFAPELIPDYKALRGDPSDNIIGVAGIGEKTGTELIQKFGNIDKIYKILKKDRQKFLDAGIKERIAKLLEDNEDEARFSLVLATARRDAPINLKLKSEKFKLDQEKVKKMFEELGFKSLIPRISIQEKFPAVKPPEEQRGELVDSETEYKTKLAQFILDSNEGEPSGEGDLEKLKLELKEKNLLDIYENMELPLIPILRKAEEFGILVDQVRLEELRKNYHKRLAQIQKKIWEHAGEEFNINSPKQIGEIFFAKMGLSGHKMKRTKTGQISTNANELEKLKGSHTAIDLLLEHRMLAKLLSTYIDVMPSLLDKGYRLHTHFVQWGAATGRISSKDPNMQNIPIKTEEGRAIREVFVAPKGRVLASLDYSQIDLRSLAVLSGDAKLIKFFKSGGDIHADVASELFGVPKDKIDKEMRRKAKVINFGIIYGMGVLALKANLGGTRAEAEEFYKKYFETFPTIQDYLNKTIEEAHSRGFTETLFGRRRYYPTINSGPEYMQKAAERQAQNAPIQGTSADVIKLAMIEVDKEITKRKWSKRANLLLQIHDELLYEIDEDDSEEILAVFKERMESVMSGRQVPFPVKAKSAPSWADL